MAEPLYRIGTVARLAGISTHALRVWERRYGVPAPARSEGGARLYSEAEVARLRLLKRAVDRGHPIGQLVPLDRDTLERLAGARAGLDGARDSSAALGESAAELVTAFLQAVRDFDAAHAQELLDRASLLFSARMLVLDVLAPLLARIGDEWADGGLCSASEHLGSALVRDHASQLMRKLSPEPGAELIVVSTPAGELHELGAMLAATTAKMRGFDVLYLGPDLPASQIALAARSSQAAFVALSVLALEVDRAVAEIDLLLAELPEHVELLVGGPLAETISRRAARRLTALGNLGDFEALLATRARTPTALRRTR
jgi:DNA-binding transcriptional MerR regulator/methylmalonyl-CoA mutase cobalamin-binding subunit